MDKPQTQAIRQKITGILLRHARLRAGRSQTELAAALHVSRQRYAQYEAGQSDLTLSQLELIAELCGVPVSYFFDDNALVEDEGSETAWQATSRLKNKIMGMLLCQARQQAGKSQKDCATVLGISPRLISQYEKGEREIPSAELEALAAYLGVPVSYFAVRPLVAQPTG